MTNLVTQLDNLESKIQELYNRSMALNAQAKLNLQKSQQSKGTTKDMYKQRCLIALKKKKQLQQQIKSYNAQSNTIQGVIMNAQNLHNQKEMIKQLQHVVKTQKKMIKRFDIDKMDELQDEMLNMKMQTDMMNQIMTEGYDMDDEDEQFEAEFMEIQKEVAKQRQTKNIGQKNNPAINTNSVDKNTLNLDDFMK